MVPEWESNKKRGNHQSTQQVADVHPQQSTASKLYGIRDTILNFVTLQHKQTNKQTNTQTTPQVQALLRWATLQAYSEP
jgi:hypothetical protein